MVVSGMESMEGMAVVLGDSAGKAKLRAIFKVTRAVYIYLLKLL